MKSRRLLALIALLFPLTLLPSITLADNEVLFNEDFDGGGGQFAKRLISKKQVSLAKGMGPDGSDAIRVAYVGYNRGSERVTLNHRLKKGVKSATMTFDVMFDKDFQFVRGGKLHGLAPDKSITGGKNRSADGWSARIMFKEKGRCAYYLYEQSPKLKWGLEKTASRSAFKTGKWQSVTLQVGVNDAGKSNGFTKIMIDGKMISQAKNVKFRGIDNPKTLITQCLFSTFHGGQSPPYAPVDKSKKFTTVHAYFDNFKVVEGIK